MKWSMTSWRIFWSQKMRFVERLQGLFLILLPRLIGPFWFETKLDASKAFSANTVTHDTRIQKWGMMLLESRERFSLQPDGLTLRVTGFRRAWPSRKIDSFYGSTGKVSEDARSANYSFPWFGARISQHVEIEADGLDIITMHTDWSRGIVRLRRTTTELNSRIAGERSQDPPADRLERLK